MFDDSFLEFWNGFEYVKKQRMWNEAFINEEIVEQNFIKSPFNRIIFLELTLFVPANFWNLLNEEKW